jgi:sugar O-acyltransferase (sialic acid O-acetyltransferase NeuD family)
MMRDLIIFGAGGHGRDILQAVRAINSVNSAWHCIGFAVDPGFPAPDKLHDLPVIVGIDALLAYGELDVAVAVGDPAGRERIVDRLGSLETIGFPTLIHPRACIGDRVYLGVGTIVLAGAIITTDVEVGAHTHVNVSSTISHDTRIGTFSTLSPSVNIAGRVTIGARVQIGAGASIIPGVEVGDDSVIGAGAAVIHSIPAGVTAVGVPARVLGPPERRAKSALTTHRITK